MVEVMLARRFGMEAYWALSLGVVSAGCLVCED